MAKNINQIATAASSILSTDKLYLGRSPFGVTDDRYILGSSIIAQFSQAGFTNVTGAAQTIAVNSKYVANNAGSSVAFTLPATSAVGSEVEIVGSCSGGWNIIQLALQSIHFNGSVTTVGILGSVTTTNRYNSIKMVCIVANLEWVIASASGNLTIA